MRMTIAAIVLFVPIAIYFAIIRPRLKARFLDLYAEIDNFWERQWARILGMRSLAIAVVGAVAYSMPTLLMELKVVDWSFLPQPWGVYVSTAVSVLLILARAFATTPVGTPPSGER